MSNTTFESGGTDADLTAPSSDRPGYTVSIEPVGEVEFDAVPETWVTNSASWADMDTALGPEPPKAVWLTSRYHTHYYDEIDGLSVDKSDVPIYRTATFTLF